MKDGVLLFKVKETLANNALAASDPEWKYEHTCQIIGADIIGPKSFNDFNFFNTYLFDMSEESLKEVSCGNKLALPRMYSLHNRFSEKSKSINIRENRPFGMKSQLLKGLLNLDNLDITEKEKKIALSSAFAKRQNNSLWFRDERLFQLGTIDASLYNLPPECKHVTWDSSVHDDSKLSSLNGSDMNKNILECDFRDFDPSVSIRTFRKLAGGDFYKDKYSRSPDFLLTSKL